MRYDIWGPAPRAGLENQVTAAGPFVRLFTGRKFLSSQDFNRVHFLTLIVLFPSPCEYIFSLFALEPDDNQSTANISRSEKWQSHRTQPLGLHQIT